MTSIAIDRLDGLSSATAMKGPCRVATTANITLSGEQTIDTVAAVEGDRVLVKDQTDATTNGIYSVNTGLWTRTKDFSGNRDVQKGTRVYVTDGAVGRGDYRVTAENPISIGSDSITIEPSDVYTQFSSPNVVNRTIQEEFETLGAYPLARFGIVDDDTIDQLDLIQTAFDEGVPLWANPWTFLCDGQLLIPANLKLHGAGRGLTTFKLADSADVTFFNATNVSGFELSDFDIDCNRDNQTSGGAFRGIYVLSSAAHCENIRIARLNIADIESTGLMLSASDPANFQAGRYSAIEQVKVTNCGGTAFNGGVGGRGQTMWLHCHSIEPGLNGFKSAGYHLGCTVEGNYADTGEGEGFETEYDADIIPSTITYQGCRVYGAGGGWRLNGTAHVVRILDCYAEEIETSVVTAFGTINELHINGLTGKNFGKSASRGSTTGLDLISLIDVSSADPSRAYLSNLKGEDDQGSPTGEYLVYVDAEFREIFIGGNNDAESLKEGAFNFPATLTDAQIRVRGYTRGWSAELQDEVATTVGGSAATYDLKTHTLRREEVRLGTSIEFEARFTFSGTNGTKEIRFQLDAQTAVSLATWTSGQTDSLYVRGHIYFPTATTVILQFDLIAKGSTVGSQIGRAYSSSSGNDIALKFLAVIGGTDTAIQPYWKMRAVN